MTTIVKNIKIVIGIFIGALIGFAYYKFIGCASGTCAITSNPFVSTLYGALLGGLMGLSSKNKQQKK
jgi:hypothetical protein